MKAINTLLATIFLTLSAFAGDAKSDRTAIRKPYGSRVENVKYDGFIIIGGYHTPLDWPEKIIKHLKIIEKGAPDMYRLGQKHAWKIQFNGHTYSCAWAWANRIGICLRDYNFGLGNLTDTLIHEFMHCNPIDGSHGPVYYAAYRYGKRCGVHPYILAWSRAYAIGLDYSEEKWLKQFPNWK